MEELKKLADDLLSISIDKLTGILIKVKKMNNNIKQAVYETAKELHEAGLISSQRMEKYKKLNIPPIHRVNPEDIKNLREKEKISQSVLAACLNVSISAVRKWETGEKKPGGLALKLLNIVQKKGLNIIL
ncbi:MAG: putative transcriptional regulator [Pseudomonadota bacterium]|nr:putative transcriptional regulator [Pseudomonadota bacterium]